MDRKIFRQTERYLDRQKHIQIDRNIFRQIERKGPVEKRGAWKIGGMGDVALQ